ncbi:MULTISPECIES: metallophosphoesterase family protein [unclassified Aeromicrobium]|uniref:metallophosphoesterase family protein n=1 Tax=unclassified Aeromicrobium TaxID=2633570 RepID=UPI0028899157|nr:MULTISPECIES: metallophosphoesterase family protein [unclassified Aeromicrobium]
MRNGLASLAATALVLTGCSTTPEQERLPAATEAAVQPAASTRTPPTAVVLTPSATPSTAQTFTWRSAKAWKNQRVVARPMSGGPEVRAPARRKAATTARDSGSVRPAYTATLRGLQPGTRYRYRVANDGGSAGDFFFTTPATELEPWTFLTLGDTQVDNADRPAAIVKAAVKRFPTANLVLHAGDVVNHPWVHQEWVDLMAALAPVRMSRNVVASIGNHEQCVLVKNCRSGQAQGFRTYFSSPSNGVTGQRPTWYRFDQQGVRFVVLDSFGSDLAAQARFLDAQLQDNPNRWSVVLLHAGPFASRADRTNSAVFSTVLPVIEKHDVDLVLSGHDHVFSSGHRGDPDSTVFATSVSGPKYYEISRADWDRRGATRARWAERISTYQVVDVAADTLRFRSIVASKGSGSTPSIAYGAALDDVTITKDADGDKSVTRR